MKNNGVKPRMTTMRKIRRRNVLNRLKVQLEKGTKRSKEGELVNLTEKDIKRINKEITTLKERI